MIRRILTLCLLSLTLTATAARAADGNLVFRLEATREHPRNSEGAFATLKSGKIIYVYSQFSEGHSDFSPCRIAQVESTDQGRTWSQPRVLFTAAPGTMEMSVSLLRLASGKLACFTLVKRGLDDCRPYLRISADEGATWSESRSLLDVPGYFVLNNDRVIQTKSGRLIMPVAWHRKLPSHLHQGEMMIDLRGIALWYYSDDGGATWTESATWWALPAATKTGLQEPGVVELADGSLLSWARTDQGQQYGMRSRDQGVTWSAPEPMAMRSPAAPASILRLPGSPDLLASFIDYSGQFPLTLMENPYSGRTPMVTAVSSDGGITWRNHRILEGDPTRDYCYIGMHFAGDAVLFGYLAVSRDPARPSTMDIRRVSVAELTAPDDDLAKQAKAALRGVIEREESWIKIHAAEALLAGGEPAEVRAQFLKLSESADRLPYRVGVWRVLTHTSATLPERRAAVAQVEKIFLDPRSPDRSQALETLCKVRHPVTGAALAATRELAAGPDSPLRGLAWWALSVAKEPQALDSLIGLLQSPEPGARMVAAYALRMMREQSPTARVALAKAAAQEPVESRGYPYVISAAFALDANPAQATAWRAALMKLLNDPTASDAVRFEVCQGLQGRIDARDRGALAKHLASEGNDTRVGAALLILTH